MSFNCIKIVCIIFNFMSRTSSNSIQVNVYLIDRSVFEEGKSDSEIINSILEEYRKTVNEDEKFVVQTLKPNLNTGEYKVEVYFSEKTSIPKWRKFLNTFINEGESILHKPNMNVSFLTFVYGAKNSIYAICGGLGNFALQGYIDQNFGIDILARLIKQDSKAVNSLQERGFTGNVIASTKYYRSDAKLSDEDEFGKIYKSVQAELDKSILSSLLGFTEDDVKKGAGCIAKSSFQVNKSVDFDFFVNKLIPGLATLLEREANFNVNKVVQISNRGEKNKALISKLKSIFIQNLYEFITKNKEFDIDFCHQDFEKFINACEFYAKKKNTQNLKKLELNEIPKDQIIKKLLEELHDNNLIDLSNLDLFQADFPKIQIITHSDEGYELTKGSLLAHMNCEIEDESGRKYFLLDDQWYEIKSNFLEDLNRNCQNTVKDYSDNDLIKNYVWTTDEDKFNSDFIGESGFLVLHKCMPRKIELCDVLHIDGEGICLIHVKNGFSNSTRELAAQIRLSAQRLHEDLNSSSTEYPFLREIYNAAKEYKDSESEYLRKLSSQFGNLSFEDFLKHFNRSSKEISFCAAIHDNAQTSRNLQSEISKFSSSIAKFSLIDVCRSVRSLGYDFKVCQIVNTP